MPQETGNSLVKCGDKGWIRLPYIVPEDVSACVTFGPETGGPYREPAADGAEDQEEGR